MIHVFTKPNKFENFLIIYVDFSLKVRLQFLKKKCQDKVYLFFISTAFMQSTKTQRLPSASPLKSSVCKTSTSGSLRNISPLKHPTKKKPGTRGTSQSDTRLTSSLRKLSLTPNPQPPSRSKSISPRKAKLSHVRGLSSSAVHSVEDIVSLIKGDKCKNIIVMAGAGISTPSGIPDFR